MAYDDVLERLGQFGPYQRRIFLLLCLPAISCALHKLSGVFLQARVLHRCRLPQEDDNATYWAVNDTISGMVYPYDPLHKARSTCLMYKTNFTESYLRSGEVANETVHCEAGWVYDNSNYLSTTLTEYDLVCDKAWLKATSDAALMIGVMLGSIIFGDLSDRVGRKPIFFISLVMQVFFGILVALSPNYYSFIFSRMIVGSTTSGVYLVAYVIAMEMVGPKKRMLAGVIFQMFFTAGFVLTAGFAFFIRDWRTLQVALTLPGIAFFTYWWFIPESVRWLLTKGRWENAKENLRAVAAENKKTLPESVLDDLCREIENEKKKESSAEEKPSLLDMFKYPNLRKKSFVIFFLWFVNAGTYYGLSWNTADLGGNEYINFVISGAVEVPAYTFLIFTLNKWGRKAILCGSMIAAGVSLIVSSLINEDLTWAKITFAMLGKLAITASYGTVYVLTAEQFPTVIRNVGLGAASTFARVGGILAPYVNIMAEIWTPLPLIVFGVMALGSGTSALILPETLNRKLPETIEDGEKFGKNLKEYVALPRLFVTMEVSHISGSRPSSHNLLQDVFETKKNVQCDENKNGEEMQFLNSNKS